MSLKVLMLASRPDPLKRGGVSGHIHNLTDWLCQLGGCEVTLLSFSDAESRSRQGGKTEIAIRRSRWHKYMPLVPMLKISSVVSSVKPDIIHVQGSSVSYGLLYALFLAPRGIPKIVTVHGHPVEEGQVFGWAPRGSLRSRSMSWCERKIPDRFDVVVTVTEKLMADLRQRYDSYSAAEITAIPNGVDPHSFTDRAPKGDIDELGLRYDKGVFTILCAKGLIAFNGQDVLIRSLPEVSDRVPRSRLLLAGDGPESSRLRELAERLGVKDRVNFLGQVPNSLMPRLISLADVVVLPSRRIDGVEEGSSLSVMEAMASGKPVIASDVGGSTETIEDGRTGLLVPENDPSSLASAILRIHGDPTKAEEMGQNAREFVLRERTWERISARCLSVYRSAVESHRR